MCGWCVRRSRPRRAPTPRVCRSCNRLARHAGLGQCDACYQRDPARLSIWVAGSLERLGEEAPWWFEGLCHDLVVRCATAVTLGHLRRVERAITNGVAADPASLLEALRTQGRSPGALARLVNEFFERHNLGSFFDEETRLATGRRERRLDRLTPRMRPAVEAYADHLVRGQQRAQLHGHSPLAHRTIDVRLADVAALAAQLGAGGVDDWSTVTAVDIEAFITTNVSSRLASSRSFFAFAKRRKLILVDPSAQINRSRPRGFSGHILSREHQRALLQRWVMPTIDAHERAVGLLCLLHGASGSELRALTLDDIDLDAGYLRLGRRPHPVPIDPATSSALGACLTARTSLQTTNRHLIVTRNTRGHDGPCSEYFMGHLLDPAGVRPSVLRHTRIADLAHRVDPRLTAIAFGMTEQGALHYVTDAVDNEEIHFGPDL